MSFEPPEDFDFTGP